MFLLRESVRHNLAQLDRAQFHQSPAFRPVDCGVIDGIFCVGDLHQDPESHRPLRNAFGELIVKGIYT